jgi:hypothetical protein
MMPELPHPLFIRFVSLKIIKESWIEKFAFLDSIASHVDFATPDVLNRVRGEIKNVASPVECLEELSHNS